MPPTQKDTKGKRKKEIVRRNNPIPRTGPGSDSLATVFKVEVPPDDQKLKGKERAGPSSRQPPKRSATLSDLPPPKQRRMDDQFAPYDNSPSIGQYGFQPASEVTPPAPGSSSGPSSSRLHDVPPHWQVNPASQPHSQTIGITSGPSGSQHPPQVNPEV